jgi:hypothetical protein
MLISQMTVTIKGGDDSEPVKKEFAKIVEKKIIIIKYVEIK